MTFGFGQGIYGVAPSAVRIAPSWGKTHDLAAACGQIPWVFAPTELNVNGSYSPDRRVYVRVHLDANRINARQRLTTVNQLEQWHKDGVVEELFMSQVAQTEARSGGNPIRTRKALGYIFSMTMTTTSGEVQELREIETILAQGSPLDDNTKRDAEIVFNAKKYSAILATADRGILSNSDSLAALGVRVMSAQQLVDFIREKIAERDDLARQLAEHYNEPVPEWVGRD